MTSDGRPQQTGTAPDDAAEQSDVPAGKTALLLAGLVAALLLVCTAVAGMLILFGRLTPPSAPPPPAALEPPEPRLQVYEPRQRHRLEAEGEARIRPESGQGIDAAMGRVAAEGWGEHAP